MTRLRFVTLGVCVAAALACNDDSTAEDDGSATEDTTGDGDGDPSGDGDGDPSGDGDGDPSGDGDGDPSGDGDGDPSGDGDGDPSGDGDADGDCLSPGRRGPLDFEPVEVPLSEFFSETNVAKLFYDDDVYMGYFDQPPPADLGESWLLFNHDARRPIGTTHAIASIENAGNCKLNAVVELTRLADNCDNFSYTRTGPAAATLGQAFYEPDITPTVQAVTEAVFDCAEDGLGEFEDCSETLWCAPGLICAGITRADSGLCMDASLRGEFESGALDLAIPPGDSLIDTLEATDLATVDTDVIIHVTLDHPDLSALTITLTNPSNNEVMVWDQEPGPHELNWYGGAPLRLERVPEGFSGDESVNGTWTLTISDAGGQGGSLVDWGLEIMSRFD